MPTSRSPLRSPLARVRGLGSAKTGTEHFWFQRLTAVALVPLTLAFAVVVLRLAGAGHAPAAAVLGHPLVAGIGMLLVVAAFWHLRLGVQVVIEDYVADEGAKLVLQLLNSFACTALGLACLLALLSLAFGG
jgi:succinate dehydrogenase / fumarate reductase membrane anchor subunit